MLANTINEFRSQANDGTLWLNWAGYNGGTSYYRDLRVGNGKHDTVLSVDGSLSRVGIGTTSLPEKLNIGGDIWLQAGGDVVFGTDNVRVYESSGDLHVTADDDIFLRPDDDIYIGKGDTTDSWVRFDTGNERLGIGTTSPGYRLDVNGAAMFRDGLLANGGIDLTGGMSVRMNGDSLTLYSKSPGYAYEGLRFRDCYGSSHAGIRAHSPGTGIQDGDLEIWTDAGGDITFSGRRVGIGTTAPEQKLDVNGNTVVRGNLYLASPGDRRLQALIPGYAQWDPMLALYCLQPDALYHTVLVPPIGGFIVSDCSNTRANMTVKNDGYVEVAQYVIEHSDSRTKLNQRPLTYGLAEILALEPKFYHPAEWTTDENGYIRITEETPNDDIGLVAQEVHEVIPEAVQAPEDESRQLWYMSYSKITTVLVKAVQEQQAEIENLENTVQELTRRIEALEQSR